MIKPAYKPFQMRIKRSYFVLSFLFLSLISALGQTWCPPGATWHYFINFNTIGAYKSGVEELKYTGTVSANSIVCKQIVGTFTGVMPYPMSPVITSTILDIKTYENNQVYYLYDPQLNTFDTLVNFNASIGDKWRTPGFASMTATCQLYARPIVTVLDTGHVTINSVYLKKVVVHNSFFGYNDTIVERIAGINQFLSPYHVCSTDWAPFGRLMCYEDSNFPLYKKTGFANCIYDPTGISENEKAIGILISPNPVKDKMCLSISGSFKANRVELIDIAGRMIKRVKLNDEPIQEVDLSELEKGIYFFELYDDMKVISAKKFIKE